MGAKSSKKKKIKESQSERPIRNQVCYIIYFYFFKIIFSPFPVAIE